MHERLPPDTIVTATSTQVSCDLNGEAAILNLADGVYYTLNTVGARIWQLIQTPTDVKALQGTIVREYQVAPDQCEEDVQCLLRDLAACGLLTIHQRDDA